MEIEETKTAHKLLRSKCGLNFSNLVFFCRKVRAWAYEIIFLPSSYCKFQNRFPYCTNPKNPLKQDTKFKQNTHSAPKVGYLYACWLSVSIALEKVNEDTAQFCSESRKIFPSPLELMGGFYWRFLLAIGGVGIFLLRAQKKFLPPVNESVMQQTVKCLKCLILFWLFWFAVFLSWFDFLQRGWKVLRDVKTFYHLQISLSNSIALPFALEA